jgi:hypothetical protein
LRLSGGRGWSCRAAAQQRPRVSKLGLKGPSDYHLNKIAVKVGGRFGRGKAQRRRKRLKGRTGQQL